MAQGLRISLCRGIDGKTDAVSKHSQVNGDEVREPMTCWLGCSTKWLWKKESVEAEQKEWEKRPITVAGLEPRMDLRKRGQARHAFGPEWTEALPFPVLIGPVGKILWKHGGALHAVELRGQILKAIE